MHDLGSHHVIILITLVARTAKEIVQRLRILVNQLGKLGIRSSDLLQKRLDQSRVLLNHLDDQYSLPLPLLYSPVGHVASAESHQVHQALRHQVQRQHRRQGQRREPQALLDLCSLRGVSLRGFIGPKKLTGSFGSLSSVYYSRKVNRTHGKEVLSASSRLSRLRRSRGLSWLGRGSGSRGSRSRCGLHISDSAPQGIDWTTNSRGLRGSGLSVSNPPHLKAPQTYSWCGSTGTWSLNIRDVALKVS